MNTFPLYTSLLSKLPKKDLTVLQKNKFIKEVVKLDLEAQELVYALIKCYSLDHSTNNFPLPYEGKSTKNRIDFNLLSFPIELRQLLYRFITIHLKKVKEDSHLKT